MEPLIKGFVAIYGVLGMGMMISIIFNLWPLFAGLLIVFGIALIAMGYLMYKSRIAGA